MGDSLGIAESGKSIRAITNSVFYLAFRKTQSKCFSNFRKNQNFGVKNSVKILYIEKTRILNFQDGLDDMIRMFFCKIQKYTFNNSTLNSRVGHDQDGSDIPNGIPIPKIGNPEA